MILRDVINIFNKSAIKAGEGSENGKYPLYTCSPIINKYLNEFICEKEAIILSTGGNFSIHYVNGKFNYSTDCLVFNSITFKTKYLYYYLLSKKGIINNMFRGSGLKHLNKKELMNLELTNVEPSIQEKIIKELDYISNAISNRKNQIQNFDDLIKSQFFSLFGDVENNNYKKEKLYKIAKVSSSHRVFTSEFVESGVPFFRGMEISQLANDEVPKINYYISEEHYKKICDKDTKPKIGDLLLPSICDKGQIWQVNTDKPFYYKDGRVLSISLFNNNINKKYFHYYMKLKTISEYSKLGTGTTFSEFKIFILKNLDIIIPPIDLQDKFADILNIVEKNKKLLKKDIDDLEQLLQIKMNKYFN